MNRKATFLPPRAAERHAVRSRYAEDEAAVMRELAGRTGLTAAERQAIAGAGAGIVTRVRRETSPSMMESLLAEHGLSTEEGVGLMCLAEALLRVPDAETIDELIQEKIEPSDWGAHLGRSASSLVNASTWALMLTGRVLNDAPGRPAAALRGLVRRVGEPVVRNAVRQSMRLLGRQFVLGQTIEEGMRNACELEKQGYTYSYVILGEAARTEAGALQLLPGDGPTVAGPLTSDPRIAGVCFTGSTDVARIIHKALAENAGADAVLADAVLIARDRWAERDDRGFDRADREGRARHPDRLVPECGAALLGASDALRAGGRARAAARDARRRHGGAEHRRPVAARHRYLAGDRRRGAGRHRGLSGATQEGRQAPEIAAAPTGGSFASPAVVRVGGIDDLEREVFRPLLHVATFKAHEIDRGATPSTPAATG